MYTFPPFPLPKAQDHTVGLCDSDCPLVVVTSQMYDRYQCFAGWAGEQEIDPPDPFVAQIVSFPHSLFLDLFWPGSSNGQNVTCVSTGIA